MSSLNETDIIVTRPEAQAEIFAQHLVELGARVLRIPLLQISPVIDEPSIQAIKNCILDLDYYQKIIFVSQNAVSHGMQWIENYWPQMPVRLDFFAIGSATANLLQSQFSIAAMNLAQDENAAMTSEALLESPWLQKVQGEKILIIRGQGGRGHLAEVLRQRGAQVNYCEVYRRSIPETAGEQLTSVFVARAAASVPVLCFHSGETLENFVKIIAQWPKNLIESAYNARLLVPSQRVAEMARSAGFGSVIVADNATDACMINALVSRA